MIKKYLIFSLVLIIFGLVFVGPVMAKNNKKAEIDLNSVLPEEEGVYNIKNHPEMKLRVFVRRVKPNPNPNPNPILGFVCNFPDTDSTAIVSGAGWELPNNKTWTYRLNLSSVPLSVGKDNLITIASNAYNVWQEVSNKKVSFKQGANTTINKARFDKQNIVTWGRASSSALAVSYIWYSAGLAIEVDTIMNNKFTWAWSNPTTWGSQTSADTTCAYENVYDAQNILTHELGHTMGLDDHYTSDYQNNTMFGYGSTGETKKNTLTNGDIAGVKNLY